MGYWDGVLSRVNLPGLILLALGAVATYFAPRLAPRLFPKGGDRAVMPLKVAGLALAVAGALMSLGFPA